MNEMKKGGREFRPKNRRPRRKVCAFCASKQSDTIDYKEVEMLRNYIAENGKILPRRMSGACAQHQRQITTAVKRARYMALLPYMSN